MHTAMADQLNPTDDDIIRALSIQLSGPPADPSQAAPYPANLPLELALETAPLKEILESYNITPGQAKKIFGNPAFKREYELNCEAVKIEGYSFKRKAQAQAEEYLNVAWVMANDQHTPAPVRADIIKNTVKWAALDQPDPVQTQSPGFLTPDTLRQLQNMPDSELEIQVMRIVSKRRPPGGETKLIEGETL